MMRRVLAAAICGAWVAILSALFLPLPLALLGSGVSSAGLTPLFYGLWAAAAIWMYALKSTKRTARTSLIVGGMLTLLIAVFAWWPPMDHVALTVMFVALPCTAAQWYIASRVRAISRGGNR